MKLSIITINYNNAEGLQKTLASVAAQTYRGIEHIIIDGGSTDGSVDVIREYEKQNSLLLGRDGVGLTIIWVSEKDKGIYNAMNKGIEIALGRRVVNALNRSTLCGDKTKGNNRSELVNDDHTSNITHHTSLKEHHTSNITHNTSQESLNVNHSELVEDNHHTSNITHQTLQESPSDYIQILNSGDLLAAPDVTERMMAALSTLNIQHSTENDSPVILYGNMIRDFGNGKVQRDTAKAEGDAREVEWTMDDFIKGTVNHDPTYIHRSLYEKYGLYDENLKICSDWKWFVNAVVFGEENLYYVPIDVTIFDTTGISETNLEFREKERHIELEKMLPTAILKDYNRYHFMVEHYKRLKKYHLWGLVYFIERVLFKLEKWGVLS